MRLLCLYASVLAFLIALALCWPEPMPHEPGYTVKQFCAEHPDICSSGRLAKFGTPSPIPHNKGYVLVYP